MSGLSCDRNAYEGAGSQGGRRGRAGRGRRGDSCGTYYVLPTCGEQPPPNAVVGWGKSQSSASVGGPHARGREPRWNSPQGFASFGETHAGAGGTPGVQASTVTHKPYADKAGQSQSLSRETATSKQNDGRKTYSSELKRERDRPSHYQAEANKSKAENLTLRRDNEILSSRVRSLEAEKADLAAQNAALQELVRQLKGEEKAPQVEEEGFDERLAVQSIEERSAARYGCADCVDELNAELDARYADIHCDWVEAELAARYSADTRDEEEV